MMFVFFQQGDIRISFKAQVHGFTYRCQGYIGVVGEPVKYFLDLIMQIQSVEVGPGSVQNCPGVRFLSPRRIVSHIA